MTILEQVRAKVIELVPEVRGRRYVQRGSRGAYKICSFGSPITLADVLRAIGEDGIDFSMDEVKNGHFTMQAHHGPGEPIEQGSWNLALSLDEQEPEVHAFLAKILCHD